MTTTRFLDAHPYALGLSFEEAIERCTDPRCECVRLREQLRASETQRATQGMCDDDATGYTGEAAA